MMEPKYVDANFNRRKAIVFATSVFATSVFATSVFATSVFLSINAGDLRATAAAPPTEYEGGTFANGNLIIPKVIRMAPIHLPKYSASLDVLLTNLFNTVHVPFVLAPETSQHTIGGEGDGPFGAILAGFLGFGWDCRIEKGVYIVFRRPTTGIVPGRPDLDTRLFLRETLRVVSLRSFFKDLFAEANLPYKITDDCPLQMLGMKIKCRFREALKAAIRDTLTFTVRDGVYCIYPRPDI